MSVVVPRLRPLRIRPGLAGGRRGEIGTDTRFRHPAQPDGAAARVRRPRRPRSPRTMRPPNPDCFLTNDPRASVLMSDDPLRSLPARSAAAIHRRGMGLDRSRSPRPGGDDRSPRPAGRRRYLDARLDRPGRRRRDAGPCGATTPSGSSRSCSPAATRSLSITGRRDSLSAARSRPFRPWAGCSCAFAFAGEAGSEQAATLIANGSIRLTGGGFNPIPCWRAGPEPLERAPLEWP